MIRRPLAAAALALCGVGAVACGGGEVSDTGASAPAAVTPQVGQPAATQNRAADTAGQGASQTAGSETDITTVPDTRTAAASATASETAAKPLDGKRVVIDPGHNSGNYRHAREINKLVDIANQKKACDTTGTSTNDGYTEAAFTWDVSNRLTKLLKARGATVTLTRSAKTQWGPCIDERAAIGNENHADAARLGKDVRDAFHEGTGLPYSNYIGKQAMNYRSDLGGLNLSKVPKIFIECGNMRNAADAAKFKNREFRQRMAEALAQGLEKYLTSAR